MKNKTTFLLFIGLFILLQSCSSPWVKLQGQKEMNATYVDNKVYTLKKALQIDAQRNLPKGSKVKVYINYSSDWVKVYAYRSNQERLTAVPILAIFILKDDIKEEGFPSDIFRAKFDKIFQ